MDVSVSDTAANFHATAYQRRYQSPHSSKLAFKKSSREGFRHASGQLRSINTYVPSKCHGFCSSPISCFGYPKASRCSKMSSHDNESGGTYHSDNIQHHPFSAAITAKRNDHRQRRLNNKPPKAPSQQEPSFQLSLPTPPSARSSVTSGTPPTQTSPPTIASPNTKAASATRESPPSTPPSPKWPSTTSTQQNHGQHRRKPNASLHRRQGRHRFL